MEETRFTAMLNWVITNKCNFHCHYCVNEPHRNDESLQDIDADAVTRNLDMQGETFCINITGGEPTIVPNFVKLIKAITKSHYVSLNSNLVSKNVEELSRVINPERIVDMNASLHIFELEKYNLFDKYISNILLFKNLGINIFASIVGHHAYLPVLRKYVEILKKNNITLVGHPFIGEHNNKKYPESYTPEEIKEFHIKEDDINNVEKYFRKNKPCSAGFNFGSILNNGDIIPCYRINSGMGNILTGFKLNKFIVKCPSDHCPCPLVEFYPHLLKNAIRKAPQINENFELLFYNNPFEPVYGIQETKETSEANKERLPVE